MMRTKTFKVEYKYFEPGTIVIPCSRRSPLEDGKVYKVIECHEPMYAGDEAIVFVEGHKYGVQACYLQELKQ